MADPRPKQMRLSVARRFMGDDSVRVGDTIRMPRMADLTLETLRPDGPPVWAPEPDLIWTVIPDA